jgi:hypothetical protein
MHTRTFSRFLFSEKTLFWICVASLALRLLFLVVIRPTIHGVEDYNIARHLAAGDGYEYADLGKTAMKVPLYPAFLAVFIWLFGDAHPLVIAGVQHALIAFVPLSLLRLGKELGEPELGVFAALVFAIHPSYLYYPTVLEVTNLFVPLSIVWSILFVQTWNVSTLKNALWLGGLSGMVLLTQPVAMIPMMGFLVLLAIKKTWQHAAVAFVVALLIASCWTARNYAVFQKVILAKSAFWGPVYLGFTKTSNGSDRYNLIADSTQIHIDSTWRTVNETVMETTYKAAVMEAATRDPVKTIEKFFYQCGVYWWVAPRYFAENGLGIWLGRKLPVLLLNTLFVIGMLMLFRRNRSLTIIIGLVMLYFTAVYGATHVSNMRFKLDIEWLELFAVGAARSAVFKLVVRKV